MMGKLFVVGPVGGSCRDVPLRALRVLKQAALTVAQDTATARAWLECQNIQTRLLAADEVGACEAILLALATGDVAWLLTRVEKLSGSARHLFSALLERGVVAASVPGASAAVSGLAISGLPADGFTYLGLLPECPARRQALLRGAAGERWTVVCEVLAAHVPEVLAGIEANYGDRRIALCQGQDVWRGRASQVGAWSGEGQWVLVIERAAPDQEWSAGRVRKEVRARLAEGMSPRDVARVVAQRSGWPKREVYRLSLPGARADYQETD